LRDEARIIWIKRHRAFQMVFALGKLPLYQRNATHDTMALGVVLIDAHRAFDGLRLGSAQLDRQIAKLRKPIRNLIVRTRAGMLGKITRKEARKWFRTKLLNKYFHSRSTLAH
jgi:hypothetical protein